jgi:DNA-binding MarR family transcriptional regulator
MEKDGLVSFAPNPHHRRAQLVPTDKGRRTFDAAMDLQAPWINHITEGITVEEVGKVA